jgi:hypothetical protein
MRRKNVTQTSIVVCGIILIGVLVRLLVLLWADGTMVDDAYISLRYAENLLAGKGLVYNEGARVLGASSVIYPFWIALLLRMSHGLGAAYAIGISNLVAFALAAWGIWVICSPVSRRCAILVLIVFSTFVRFVDNSTIGMETPLFVLLMVASLYLLNKERLGWLSLVIALSILVRPEGVLWAIAVLVVLALKRMRPGLRQFVPGALLLGAWVVFSVAYYGSPIPQSVRAKSAWFVHLGSDGALATIGNVYGALSLLELDDTLMRAPWLRPGVIIFSVLTVGLFIYGAAKFIRKRSVLSALPVLFVLYLAFYLAGRCQMLFSWYGIPSGLAYVITVIFGMGYLTGRLGDRWTRGAWMKAAGVALTAGLLVMTVMVWKETRLPYYRLIRNSYEMAGRFVYENSGVDDRVCTFEIGMIGYSARRFVYDMGGLVSPEIASLYTNESSGSPISEVLERFEPEFVVLDESHLKRLLTYGDGAWFTANYEPLATFEAHQVLGKTGRAQLKEE